MAAPQPLPLQRNSRSLNVAYACFGFCGLYVLAGNMLEAGVAGDAGIFIGFWLAGLGLVAFVALVCGTVLALKAPRHPPLLVLCLANVLLIAGAIALLAFEATSDETLVAVMKTASWIYATLSILVSLWWFVIGKKETDYRE